MTMFSIKPPFNLAEFLAVPAPAGAARRRGAKGRGMQFQSRATTEVPSEAAETAPVTESDPTDEEKQS